MRYMFECVNCRKEFEVGCTLKEFEAHRTGKKKIGCPVCKKRPLKQVITGVRLKMN